MKQQPVQLKVDGSPVRCPFCHEGIAVEEEDWVACASCVARHHDACWGENGGVCGACGAAEALTRAGSGALASRRRLTVLAHDPQPPQASWFGDAPTALETVFEGELDLRAEAAWVEAEVRRACGVEGVARLSQGSDGAQLEWRPVLTPGRNDCAANRSLSVVLECRNGETRLRIEESHADLSGGFYGGVLGSAGAGLSYPLFKVGSHFGVPLGALTVGLWILALTLLVRFVLLPDRVEKRRKQAERLRDRMVAKLSRPPAVDLKG